MSESPVRYFAEEVGLRPDSIAPLFAPLRNKLERCHLVQVDQSAMVFAIFDHEEFVSATQLSKIPDAADLNGRRFRKSIGWILAVLPGWAELLDHEVDFAEPKSGGFEAEVQFSFG